MLGPIRFKLSRALLGFNKETVVANAKLLGAYLGHPSVEPTWANANQQLLKRANMIKQYRVGLLATIALYNSP